MMCHMHCIPAQDCLFLGWDLRCDLNEDHVHHWVLDLRISNLCCWRTVPLVAFLAATPQKRNR